MLYDISKFDKLRLTTLEELKNKDSMFPFFDDISKQIFLTMDQEYCKVKLKAKYPNYTFKESDLYAYSEDM